MKNATKNQIDDVYTIWYNVKDVAKYFLEKKKLL